MTAGLAVALAAGGCTGSGHDGPEEPERPREHSAEVAAPTPPPPVAAVHADSVRAAFQRVPELGAGEVAELRQDRNAEQTATAERMGVRVSSEGEIERLLRQGRLVALGDSTPYWVLREMDHSVPYVTPDARAMLEELGRRFHARLDSLGLPRYRMKVTSALRTDEMQADLRKTNSYAARTLSAHEFGTTVDVSHERFAAPAHARAPGAEAPGAREREREVLEELEKEYGKALQAELGRAIAEMRERGALHVMMENRQPVYHMTVAKRSRAGGALTP